MLKRLELQNTNRPIDVIKFWSDENKLYIDPPYQRGLVWGETRKRNFIRSLLLGIPVGAIVVNHRASPDYRTTVIDGKQRIASVLSFLEGSLEVPADWFGHQGDFLNFTGLSKPEQRCFRHIGLSFSESKELSIEQEAEVFELINFGGVSQGESDK